MQFLNNQFYWGLSYKNIIDMFALDAYDLNKSIIDVMGAPSSFNPITYEKRQRVITCGDVYGITKDKLEAKMSEALQQTINTIEAYRQHFTSVMSTPTAYAAQLQHNLTIFMQDYEQALHQGRYSCETLPSLNFERCQFDLAICRHFLFVRESDFDVDFHLTSIEEMCRVASEVRIFPLLNTSGNVSTHLPLVMQQLQQRGYDVEVRKVNYELQKGGNAMLRVWHQACLPN